MARKKRRPDDEDAPRRKKRRPAPVEEEEVEEEDLDELEEAEDESEEPGPPRRREDAYTGMLVITLVALIGAIVFFYLDAGAVGAQAVQAPSLNVPALGAATQPAGR